MAQNSFAKRQAIALVSRIHQLRFQQREIHIRWALNGARFARQTITERRVHLRALQRIVVKTQFESRPDRIGPAASRHVFLARGEKRRAHRRRVFPATAAAVALFQVADERFVFERERQHRLER